MGTKLTWFGHSAFQIETGEHTVLIDPFISGNPVATVSPDELAADFILLTHGHGDHIGDTVDIAKRTGATVVGNFEVANWISAQGVENTSSPNTGGTASFDFGSVYLTLAFHSSSMPDGSYGGSPNGMVITLNSGLKIFHAGDTALFSDMQLIGEMGLDVAIIPIGDFFTMGPDESVRAIQWLKPRYVLPCHYNTFPPIAQDAAQWANAVSAKTLSSAIVLDPGGTHEF
ncbi:MAG: metal-dependent hydrolase [Chloroflexi bacterium]|nr:metal-dependent hydrolase [Chloroflexota bacterium]